MRFPSRRAAWLLAAALVPAALAVPVAHGLEIADADSAPAASAAEVVLQLPPAAVTGAAPLIQGATPTPTPVPDPLPDPLQVSPGDVRLPDQLDASRREAEQKCAGANPPEWCSRPAVAVADQGDNPAQRALAAAQANLDQAQDQRLAAVKDLTDKVIKQAYAAPAQTPERDKISDGIEGANGNIGAANQDIESLQAQVAALGAQVNVLGGDARQAKEVELALAQADLASAQAAKAQGGADKANGRVSGLVVDTRERDRQVLAAALAGSPDLQTADQTVDRAQHKYQQAATDAVWYDATRAVLGIAMPDALAGWVVDTAWVPVRTAGRVTVAGLEAADELGLLDP